MIFRQLFDAKTSTYTYLVGDESTRQAVLIDPVLEQVDRDLDLIRELGLELIYTLDTHVHADHVTAAAALRDRSAAKSVASGRGAACADVHVSHGDVLRIGDLSVTVLETPGHTDDSVSFRVDDRVFTGDALLIRGCGRTDFQNGDPQALYSSITGVLFPLPDETLVYPGHDYSGHTVSTIGEEKRWNRRIAGKDEREFVALMSRLDLPAPRNIATAVPANRACGRAAAAVGS
jgi:glyoxylase-like metal-dependent hydrolase (beta-lactamase superfamily II)